jgi:large subunit ribosomal protein L17
MVTDLFRNEKLRTTDTRAKEIRRVAEKIITLAKEGTLHKRRQAGAFVRDKEVLKKLFDELAERFKDRPGGYTRITKLGFRKGDNTPISVIELVEEVYKPKKKKKAAPKKTTKPTVKDESAKAKSSKKESAEELGLIEEEDKTVAEAPVAEIVEAATEEKVTEETPEPEAKAKAKAKAEEAVVAESEPTEEVTSEETVEETSAEAAPEEQIEAKADETSEETTEENSEPEADKESEKKED